MDGRPDAELVAAHLAGDAGGLAGIYDRYADPLHDTAAAMLRDPHEAADAVQDVFVTAAEKLGQLRDPTRLKPWLFAILRHDVYRRSKRRQRVRSVDPMTVAEVVAPDDTAEAAATALDADELARSVREAAAGLDDRDQLVLELTARQGLAGEELAEALGVGLGHSHVLVHRMRDRVERSLGALVVARTGRRDCPEVDELLAGWDGELTVLLRKRLARHIEQCDVCGRTKRRAFALVGAAPALAAPAELRPRVLAAAARVRPLPPRPPRRWPGIALGAAAAVLLAAGAGVGLAVVSGEEAAAPGPDTTAPPATSTPDTTGVPGTTVATTLPVTTTTTPPTTSTTSTVPETTVTTVETVPVVPGRLDVSTGLIDLGAGESSGSLVLVNGGGTAIAWTLDAGAPFAWSQDAGALGPGDGVELVVSIDRDQLSEGDVEAVALVESDGGDAGVEVRARVERDPQVEILRGPGTVPCRASVAPIVAATVTDDSDVVDVGLEWSGPGDGGSAPLSPGGGGAWSGRITHDAVAGQWSYTVTATDARGNSGSAGGSFVVSPC